MNLTILFPALPPTLDGIGDHTARLAAALARSCRVRILTAQRDAEAIPGVQIQRVFSADRRRSVSGILPFLEAEPPDWLLVQFNQFSYGRWGLNPFLPLTLYRLRRRLPNTRIAVLFHEDFVPVINWKFAIMTLWQRLQFRMLGRQADLVLFSIDPWVRRYASWFPHARVAHLPVGSNIPRLRFSREEARRVVGLPEDRFVVGVFGTLNGARLLGHIREAVTALYRKDRNVLLLYVGPHGSLLREALPGLPIVDAGALPAEEVSVHFAAMDLHLTPFVDGVSTRRGSFVAGIQHGLPTVGTDGPLTDEILRIRDGRAWLLPPVEEPASFARCAREMHGDPELRARLGAAARAFHDEHFTWETTATRLLSLLKDQPIVRREVATV